MSTIVNFEARLRAQHICLSTPEILHLCMTRPVQVEELYDPISDFIVRFDTEGKQRDLLDVIEQSYDRLVSCKCKHCTARRKS